MSNEENSTTRDETITLLSITKKLYNLYRPHFGLGKKKRTRTFYLAGIILGNILLAFALIAVNSTMATLMGLIAVPGVTYAAFFFAAAQCITAITSYGLLTGIDSWIASLLGSSLAFSVNKQLEKSWMKNDTYYGTTRLTTNPTNPAQLLSHDSEELARSTTELFDNFLTTVSNFVVGLRGLFLLSVPLEIAFLSFSFAIPGYLVACTVLYALAYNFVTNKMGDSLEDLQSKQREMEAKLQSKVHHVKSNAEAIAFKKGADYEHQSLLETIKQTRIIQSGASKVRSLLNFATNLHAEFTSFIALLLCAPNIVSQKLSFASILEIPYHFQNVVNFFTWKNDNFDKVTECAVTLKKIDEFKASISDWEKRHQEGKANLLMTGTNTDAISIKNLTLKKPDGTAILTNYSMTIPKGRITLLQGASGVGKTSILRALAGLTPNASGAIEGIPKNVHFVPSQPYFPEEGSLLDAIMYPSTKKATPQEIQKVKLIMEELGFKSNTIQDLEIVKDWHGQHLSDGEKQRVEIVSAIMKDPDVVVLDEPTSRVDHDATSNNKGRIEKALKKYFANKTIIYTDHNPSETFCDNKIYITSSKMTV